MEINIPPWIVVLILVAEGAVVIVPLLLLLWFSFYGIQRHGWWNLLDEILCAGLAGHCVSVGGSLRFHLTKGLAGTAAGNDLLISFCRSLIPSPKRNPIYCLAHHPKMFAHSSAWTRFFVAKLIMTFVGLYVGMTCPPMFSQGGSSEIAAMSVLGIVGAAVGALMIGDGRRRNQPR